jgi:hypothetical protein
VRENGKSATNPRTSILMTIPAMKRTNLPLLLNHQHRLSNHPRTLDTHKHKALKAALYQLLRADRLQVSKGGPHQIPLHWLAMPPKYEQNSRIAEEIISRAIQCAQAKLTEQR